MRVLLLGAPGAGKGTQAQFIARDYHVPQISTGNMLREVTQSDLPLGREIRAVIARGDLVSDEIIGELISTRIAREDCRAGFLLDGFPRNLAQAELLENMGVHLDVVIDIQVPDEEIVTRISGRRTHLASGRTYHVLYQPPKTPDRDDVTGEPLVQREDDQEAVVRRRLSVYEAQTKPLMAFYRELSKTSKRPLICASVNGLQPVERVYQDIQELLNRV